MTKEEIILSIYNNDAIIKYCKSLYYAEWEELRSELIIQLYKMKDNKLYQAYYNKFLEYLCFTICKRIKVGHVNDTGIFYKHNSVEHISGEILQDIIQIEPDDATDRIHDILENQHWYGKTLFKHYYVDGYNLREISEMYGINIKSIHYSINKLKNEIKKEIENGNDDYFRS